MVQVVPLQHWASLGCFTTDNMKPETLGEVNIMFQNLEKKAEEIIGAIKENTEITKDLERRVGVTNGQIIELKRVNKEEVMPLISDYQETRARVRGAIFVVALVGMSAITIGGFALNSYLNYKTEEITQGVVQTLENKYQIEYSK